MIESMASGTPVIAIKLGSVPEIITEGVSGFMCNNIEECLNAIDKASKLDRYAVREYVSQRFGVKQMVDGYEAVYQQILAEKFSQNGHSPKPILIGTSL